MATSCCGKCGGTSFEVKEAPRIKGTEHKFMLIQCPSCGAVLNVVDFDHLPTLLRRIAEKLGIRDLL